MFENKNIDDKYDVIRDRVGATWAIVITAVVIIFIIITIITL